MSIDATGRVVRSDSGYDLVIERTYRASLAVVWDSIVDPERMNRWIGTYSGVPGAGTSVLFRMTAEGEDAPEEPVQIHECDPPHRFRVESSVGGESWMMTVVLAESDGETTLTFSQVLTDPASAENVGPGWEYYLDRLGAVLDGTPFATWDDYYPAQAAHYLRAVADATGQG